MSFSKSALQFSSFFLFPRNGCSPYKRNFKANWKRLRVHDKFSPVVYNLSKLQMELTMKKFLFYTLLALLSFGLMVNEAAAKRFGGGRSFGVQRSHSSLFSTAPKPFKTINQPQKQSRWGGLLGGLLIGSVLGALFMNHGFATGLLTWIIIGGLLFFI